MMLVRAIALVVAVVGPGVCQSGVPDLLFHAGRPMGDIRSGAMANSGCALRGGALSVWSNPALVHAYCRDFQVQGLVSGASYGRSGVLYDGGVVTAGAGYHGDKMTVVNMYRYLRGSIEPQTDYQSLVTYSGQLFGRHEKQGAVDFGVNVRYEQANWKFNGLPTVYTWYDSGNGVFYADPQSAVEAPEGSLLEKRLLFDLGFFQANVLNNLDFALVFHHQLGYVWRDANPRWVHTSTYHGLASADTIANTYSSEYQT